MSVKNLLLSEIESQIEALDDLEFGSDAHKAAVDDLTKLLSKLNEMEKIESERQEAIKNREVETELKAKQYEAENELKAKQIEEDKKDHFVKNCLTAVSVIGGFAVTIWGTYKSIKFEETGTITTIMGRGFINKLLPKK